MTSQSAQCKGQVKVFLRAKRLAKGDNQIFRNLFPLKFNYFPEERMSTSKKKTRNPPKMCHA